MRISQITWCTMPGLSLPAASLSTGYRLPARRVRHSACKHLIYIVLWSIQRGILRAESIFLPALREGSCRHGRAAVSPRGMRPARFRGRLRDLVRLALGGDLDLDGHAQRIGGKAGPGAGDRHRLARVAGDGDADQIVVADDAVGRIELDPARTREVHPDPRVSGAAADPPAFVDIEIAGYEMCSEPERAHSFHHQHREIAAAAAPQPQSPDRVLHTAFLTLDIGQILPDRVGHRCKQLGRYGAAVIAQELSRPLVDFVLWIEVLPLHGSQQIGHFVGAVGEWVSSRIFLDLKVEDIGRGLIEANDALEMKLLSSPAEPGNGNAIAKHVVDPPDVRGFRRDRELSLEQLLVVVVPRPQHHAMFAKCDRLLIAVGGDVANSDDGHRLCLLRGCRLRLCGFGRIAEKGGREVAGDGAQLLLHQVEELMETLAQNRRYVEGSEDGAQSVELLGSGVAVAQHIARLDFAEQPAGLAHAMMDRARESLVEQQETRNPRWGRARRVQAPVGVVAGCRAQQRVPLADIGRRADIGYAGQ